MFLIPFVGVNAEDSASVLEGLYTVADVLWLEGVFAKDVVEYCFLLIVELSVNGCKLVLLFLIDRNFHDDMLIVPVLPKMAGNGGYFL